MVETLSRTDIMRRMEGKIGNIRRSESQMEDRLHLYRLDRGQCARVILHLDLVLDATGRRAGKETWDLQLNL